MGAQESKSDKGSSSKEEEETEDENKEEQEQKSKKKKKKKEKKKKEAKAKKEEKKHKVKDKVEKKLSKKDSPIKEQVLSTIKASKNQQENINQLNNQVKEEEKVIPYKKILVDNKEKVKAEDETYIIDIVKNGQVTASDQKIINNIVSTHNGQLPSKYNNIKKKYAYVPYSRKKYIPDVNHTHPFINKALCEKISNEYMGFSKQEDIKGSLVKLEFSKPRIKEKSNTLDIIYQEDIKSIALKGSTHNLPIDIPLSLFLRDLEGNLVESEDKKAYIISRRKNNMSLYGQYIISTILKNT